MTARVVRLKVHAGAHLGDLPSPSKSAAALELALVKPAWSEEEHTSRTDCCWRWSTRAMFQRCFGWSQTRGIDNASDEDVNAQPTSGNELPIARAAAAPQMSVVDEKKERDNILRSLLPYK